MEPIVLAAIISGGSVITAAAINARGQLKAAVIAAAAKNAQVAPDKKTTTSSPHTVHFGFPFWMFMVILSASTAVCISEVQDASGRIDRGALTVAIVFPVAIALLIVLETAVYLKSKKKDA